jgi:hypothetical protein
MSQRPQTALHTVQLRCGTLHLCIEQAEQPLEALCGFACRRSRKRGFVFLSKVLGKHYPVRPAVMAAVHARLAARLVGLPGPVVVIGLAETATALGQGVFEQWLHRTRRDDALFLHTTRYRLDRPPLLTFEESHSHAPEHLLHEPADADGRRLLHQAVTLVLVDDELSTGRTLAGLARACRGLSRALAAVHIVCLTDWLGPARRRELAEQIGLPTHCHSLLRGRFVLQADPAFEPGAVPDVAGRPQAKDAYLPRISGRRGLRGALPLDAAALLAQAGVRPGERLLVLGTGEFAYPPFLLARHLEQHGWDVHFQATTRSPLLVGADVTSALEFVDNYHDGMPNYLYNVAGRHYDRILVGYETHPLPPDHRLAEQLGGAAVFF